LRFFYDQALGKERVDTTHDFAGEPYFTSTIHNTVNKREYFIIYQGSLITCFDRPSNGTIPTPHFNRARYIGKAEIELTPVDHWIERDEMGRDFLQIYDRIDNGYIVRMDHDDERRGHAVTFHFHEWNAGSQDPALFSVPSNILAICNSMP